MLARFFSVSVKEYRAVGFRSHGLPEKVLSVEKHTLESAGPDSVVVEMIFAPIHHNDLDVVRGTHAVRPQFPAVAGSEGLGRVASVGNRVTKVRTGDIVLANPASHFGGTWREWAVVGQDDVVSLGPCLSGGEAAAREGGLVDAKSDGSAVVFASQGPVAAKQLLALGNLKAGDTVIQTGGNGAVGLYVNQLAHRMGVKVINVVRRGPDFEEHSERVKALGGYLAVPDDYFRTPAFSKLVADLPRPALALDETGGALGAELARHVRPHGTIGVYANMSREALQIPASALIHNSLTVRGFSLLAYASEHRAQYEKDVREAAKDLAEKKLKPWAETRSFANFWTDGWAAHTDKSNLRKTILAIKN